MGLQKKELSEIIVNELNLTCTPEVYLRETEEHHRILFPDVSNLSNMYCKRGNHHPYILIGEIPNS